MALAIATHMIGALLMWGILLPSPLHELTQGLRKVQHDFFSTRLDIAVEEPVRAEPPPATPLPEELAIPAAPPVVPPPMKPRAPEQPSPAAPPPPEPLSTRTERAISAAADLVAQAAKTLTRDDDAPDAVAIASGESNELNSGEVAGAGRGVASTFNRKAALDGKTGGQGRSTQPAAPLGPDRSRRAGVMGGFTDACDFPSQADIARIDHAVVVVSVRVRPDGTAEGVTVVSDPGHGFGRAAQRCALQSRYFAARDRNGGAVAAETTVNVRFTR